MHDSPPISKKEGSLLSAFFYCSSDNTHVIRDCWRISLSELSRFIGLPLIIFFVFCSVSVTSSFSDVSFVLLKDRLHRGSIRLYSLHSPFQRYSGVFDRQSLSDLFVLCCPIFFLKFLLEGFWTVSAVFLAGRLPVLKLQKMSVFHRDLLSSCVDEHES